MLLNSTKVHFGDLSEDVLTQTKGGSFNYHPNLDGLTNFPIVYFCSFLYMVSQIDIIF